ncbi:MAG: hypothetical protein Q8928_07720 [Bacteroidota bacterium]|nr:hypothetical protein [Bacteroidota bacterium]
MKRLFFSALLMVSVKLMAQVSCSDVLQFGNSKDEQTHSFKEKLTEVTKGGLKEPARRMLPQSPRAFDGGTMAFKMKVDPQKQNYFTVRFWGSDKDKSMIMLFSEGKQVGYRHLGDIDFVWLGNGEPPLNNKFFYVTLPLPLKDTQGKKSVNLELRSYGEIWGYGESFDKYQKNMIEPTLGFYKAYIHTSPCFEPDKNEVQGKAIANPPLNQSPGVEVLDRLKNRVNKELNDLINQPGALNQLQIWFVADAYSVKWTKAYHNPAVVSKVIYSINAFYKSFLNNPEQIYKDKNVYNYEWLTIGPIARSIRELWPELKPMIDQEFDNGKGERVSLRKAWSEMLQSSLAYSTTHRRQYTNQSMIIDLFMYHCNLALMLINPSKALPESQTLHYLYESVGLTPWLGKETDHGPEKPLGDNYWQLTPKGLTKELGFVGYYGEVLDWVNDLYKATCKPGLPDSGDEKIKQQLLKMMQARSYFRYPALDENGNKAIRAEAVVGWRDANHYPGNVTYCYRGSAWDATPLMTASSTLDARAVGYARQMLDDNQFFKSVEDKLKEKGIRATKSLLFIPDEYDFIKQQPSSAYRLPMSKGMPDFVFSDEEDGVIAVKNGDDILYASLYWRARNAINRLAKVHYITPNFDRIANIYIESEFEPSGMEYTRKNWINLGFNGSREWYKGIESAHTGEVLPIAKIPTSIVFKPGDESVYAGRAQFYKMKFGNYYVAMNCTKDRTFELTIPADFRNAKDLVNNKKVTPKKSIQIAPQTSVVLYK